GGRSRRGAAEGGDRLEGPQWAAAVAGAAVGTRTWWGRGDRWWGGWGGSGRGDSAEQRAALSELGRAMAVGEQPEVPNAHEARRHDVEEEAAQEFLRREGHELQAMVVGVVFPAKPDLAVADKD